MIRSCDKPFAVNVRGVAASVKHAARVMVKGCVKGNNIICTASVAVVIGRARMMDYIMSKCAVVGLVKAASLQMGPHGIRVNCVSPEPVVTPLLCELFGMEAAAAKKAFESRCFLEGKLRVEDMGNAVLFLASNESRFVT